MGAYEVVSELDTFFMCILCNLSIEVQLVELLVARTLYRTVVYSSLLYLFITTVLFFVVLRNVTFVDVPPSFTRHSQLFPRAPRELPRAFDTLF